jgi:organic radical activating enzyme
MTDEVIKIKKTRDELNKVSPSFCLAKWYQSTLHLQYGHTHSCHHPRTHQVPIDELKTNPSALHNTEYKKSQRQLMLKGVRPPECQYCWNVEDLGPEHYSDRSSKSHEPWAKPLLDSTAKMDGSENINPTYLEVSFSNVCNLKCSYCSPAYSSSWMEEIQSQGAYPTSDQFNNLHWLKSQGKMPIPHREENPYVDAFWKWWPDLYKTLKVFRITGGEPLLSKDTFKVLDYINKNPRPELELAINSNGCVPDKLFNQYIEKMKRITLDEKIGLTRLYTSVDTYGQQAEYIRDGLNFNQWYDNICRVLEELPLTKITVMCTTGLLSLPNLHKLLELIAPLKTQFYSDFRRVPITIDTAILRHPSYLSAVVGPTNYSTMLNKAINVMNINAETHNNPYKGFFDFEIAKLKRFQEYVAAGPNPGERLNIQQVRKDFVSYIDEYDKRRSKNFCKTFPELEEFYLQQK